MNVGSIVDRVLALPLVRFVVAVLDTYGKAPGGILANGLAFAALFSALPTTLLVLGIGGLVAGDSDFQAKLAAAQYWLRLEQTWRWRKAQFDRGLVEVTVSETEMTADSTPGDDCLPIPEASDSFNDYHVLTGWGAHS